MYTRVACCLKFFILVCDLSRLCLFFFFFQAEDGIRDLYVTGVQTCALPIWATRSTPIPTRHGRKRFRKRRPPPVRPHQGRKRPASFPSTNRRSPTSPSWQIGRASCRERV